MENYIKEFFSKPKHEYDKVWTFSGGADATIDDLVKKKAKAEAEIYEFDGKLKDAYAKKYAVNYTPLGKKILLKYSPRSGNDLYFSYPSGQLMDVDVMDPKTYVTFALETKAGEISVLVGYCYELGGFIIRNLKYAIASNNQKCTYHSQGEVFEGFLEEVTEASPTYTGTVDRWRNNRTLDMVNAEEFLNTLFGTSRTIDMSLRDATYRYRSNKAFEIILKTAPDELMWMLNSNYGEAQPIYKLVGLEKAEYDAATSKGLLNEAIDLSWAFQMKSTFNKTPEEWYDLILKGKKYEKDLQFYGIDLSFKTWGLTSRHDNYHVRLLGGMADYYNSYSELKDNYSFGKFFDYVVKETIDQAYSNVGSYLGTLIDYLRMCDQQHIKPTLFSSQLDLTHNIAKRNCKISVTPESEATFKNKYLTFKPWKSGTFMVIAPENTNAVKQEGNQLDHCVASYIKRVIDGECLIYFLREKEDESLITIEVEDNAIVQARGVHNRFPNDVEILMLNKFAKDRGMKCCYNDSPDEEEHEE